MAEIAKITPGAQKIGGNRYRNFGSETEINSCIIVKVAELVAQIIGKKPQNKDMGSFTELAIKTSPSKMF
ncbi:hypothetical protein [Cohaesibacter marisflavi]|uniref:hypothetical protein n=1 Tax=Cohaesibacter marisflavi TaxID=655353 RepID=UPI0029C988EA|nr:hypothetical protein [Cohaesibacter marisflavi]